MKKKPCRMNNILGVFLIMALLISSFTFSARSVSASETEPYGYYKIIDSVNVRSGPGLDYSVVGTLSAGTVVSLWQFSGEWASITYNSGSNSGWVNVAYITKTDASSESSGTSAADSSSASASDSSASTSGTTGSSDTGSSDSSTSDTSATWASYCTVGLHEASYSGTSLYKSIPSTVTNPGSAIGENSPLLVLYDGCYFYVTEIQSERWGKVNWNGMDLWVDMKTISTSGGESSVSATSATGAGWSSSNGTWAYYGENGYLMYLSNSLYEEWTTIQGCSSSTGYYIVVNCSTDDTAIFKADGSGNWAPYIYLSCCTGREGHETIKGTYSVCDKGYSFGEPDYSCYYYTQFAPKYLFHSVIYYAGTYEIKDGSMGQNVSKGCVRLALENSKWIYDNIPLGTLVYIY